MRLKVQPSFEMIICITFVFWFRYSFEKGFWFRYFQMKTEISFLVNDVASELIEPSSTN